MEAPRNVDNVHKGLQKAETSNNVGVAAGMTVAGVRINAGYTICGCPEVHHMQRKADGEVIARQLDDNPQHEVGGRHTRVIDHKKEEKYIFLANRQRLVRQHDRGPDPAGSGGQQLVDEKKPIEFRVLPPPDFVSGYSWHQQAHGSKESIGDSQTCTRWEAAEIHDARDEKGWDADNEGIGAEGKEEGVSEVGDAVIVPKSIYDQHRRDDSESDCHWHVNVLENQVASSRVVEAGREQGVVKARVEEQLGTVMRRCPGEGSHSTVAQSGVDTGAR